MNKIAIIVLMLFTTSEDTQTRIGDLLDQNIMTSSPLRLNKYERKFNNDLSEIIVPVSKDLPFGCDLLITHQFPNKWTARGESETNKKMLPHEKEFFESILCYNKLNSVKTIECSIIGESECVTIGNYENREFNRLPICAIEDCKYRLPDFGKYECYYVYNYALDDLNTANNQGFNWCAEAGNLILYDRKLKQAKILNVYITLVKEFSFLRRFFHIDKNKQIQIFDFRSIDSETIALSNVWIISILKDGEIKIEEKN